MITMSTITTAMAMSIHSHLRRLFCRDRAFLGASMIPTMPVTTASNRKQQQTPLHAHWRLPLEPRAELAFADLACAYITSPGHGWAILVPSLFKSVYPVRACAPLTLYRAQNNGHASLATSSCQNLFLIRSVLLAGAEGRLLGSTWHVDAALGSRPNVRARHMLAAWKVVDAWHKKHGLALLGKG